MPRMQRIQRLRNLTFLTIPAQQIPYNMSKTLNSFIAYPFNPREVRDTVAATIAKLKQLRPSLVLQPWEANDVPGRCLVDPILDKIRDSDYIVADISQLNFNVIYEIGFSIGKLKRVVLIKNKNLRNNDRLISETGIFDTIGYFKYSNSEDLAKFLSEVHDFLPLPLKQILPNKNAPVYLVAPREKTESEIRLFSRVKKEARLLFRSYDPEEHGRLSARDAIDNVSASLGVILPLISNNRIDCEVHNFRCAFIAGLSHALGCETLILQAGEDPVPVDLRDAVSI